jgi:hypothetical protein
LPLRAVLSVANVFTVAADKGKYGAHDWRIGRSWSDTFDALIRHALAHQNGEDFDQDTNEPHIIHAACRALQLGEWILTGTGQDDRARLAIPKREKGDVSFLI